MGNREASRIFSKGWPYGIHSQFWGGTQENHFPGEVTTVAEQGSEPALIY